MDEYAFAAPDILLIILIAAGGIFVCLFLTTRFAKKLRLQLDPLYEATSEVAKQNLDFEVGHSNIKEFEDVLLSFSRMKESLKAYFGATVGSRAYAERTNCCTCQRI